MRTLAIAVLVMLIGKTIGITAQDQPAPAGKSAGSQEAPQEPTRVSFASYGFSIDRFTLRDFTPNLGGHTVLSARLKEFDDDDSYLTVERFEAWDGFEKKYASFKNTDKENLIEEFEGKLGDLKALGMVRKFPGLERTALLLVGKTEKGATGWVAEGYVSSAKWANARKAVDAAFSSFRFLKPKETVKQGEFGNRLFGYSLSKDGLKDLKGPAHLVVFSYVGGTSEDFGSVILTLEAETASLDQWAKEAKDRLEKSTDEKVTESKVDDWNGAHARRLSYPTKEPKNNSVELIMFNHLDCHWSLTLSGTLAREGSILRKVEASFKFEARG
jgi:hypothetical protein